MTCNDVRDDLETFVDGALGAAREAAVRAHLDACPDCRRAVEEARAFSAALGEGIRRHVGAIVPPPGAKVALLARLGGTAAAPAPAPRLRRLALAAAASVLVGLGAGLAYRTLGPGGGAAEDPGRTPLAARVAELEAVRAWQDDLARAVERNPADRPLGLVACAYLPPERGRALLKDRLGIEPSEEAVRAAWPDAAQPVVRLARSTRTGKRSSELLFVQTSDGRVHVEHTERSNGDETKTTLDAASWEILAAQNAELCRALEIVDAEGRLIAGLPIPSEPQLRREVAGALASGTAPRGAARRLLALRLAPRVKSADELERELRAVAAAAPRPAAAPAIPGAGLLRDAVRRLEAETGAARLPDAEWVDAMACLDRLRQP
jgi:hypothetical protein